MQKLYCYVDESGQETRGRLFVVAVVMITFPPDELFTLCEEIERSSGKGKFKWGQARRELRFVYLRRILAETALRNTLCYSIFPGTSSYDIATIMAIAKAVNHLKPSERYTTLVYVDGLKKSKRHPYGSELRKLGIPTRKVQGVTKDENNALVRLADAIAGFVMDALDGRDDEAQALLERARKQRTVIKV